MIKAVIDTNMLVAAFFNKQSASAKIINLAQTDKLQLYWTPDIKIEAEHILGNIGRAVGRPNNKILNQVFPQKNKIENAPKLNIIKSDPSDNKFLSCAKAANADYIISNDSDLLNVKSIFTDSKILTPGEFIRKVKLD